MSSPQVQWDEPTHQVQWDEPKKTEAAPEPKPGWLDKEIPLDSYPNATLSGVQSIGKGIRSAGQGMWNLVRPMQPNESPLAVASGSRIWGPFIDTAKQATQVPGAIHDINQSADPLGTYAKVAQDTAGEGAGQALTALATEGVGRAVPKAIDTVASPTKMGAPVRAVIRGTNKVLEKYPGSIGTAAGTAIGHSTGIPGMSELGGAAGYALGREVLPQVQIPGENIGLPKRVTGGPAVAPKYIETEVAPPSRGAPIERDATNLNEPYAGEEGAEPRSIPQQQNSKAIMYRTRDVGEQGVPHNPRARAQASESLTEINDRLAPSRGDTTGNPQETVGIDLSQVPGFSVRPGPNGPNWIKFHGETSPGISVPESAISRVGADKPAISTEQRVNMIGNQMEKGMGVPEPPKPGQPIYSRNPSSVAETSKAETLPADFIPANDSSWVKGYKYSPDASELEFITDKGSHHFVGDVRPEQIAELQKSKSVGAAINKIRKTSPDVAKMVNGKRVSVKPSQR